MKAAIINFFHIRPPFEHSQEAILDWVAKAHARAEKNAHEKTNEEFFYQKIKERLVKIGLGPNKIARRGTHKEVLNTNWEELSIAPVTLSTEKEKVGARTHYYDEAASAIFERFYEKDLPLPDYLVHVTCTGYISPSPAQKIVSKRKASCMVTHAYHMGCYASIPALRIAQGFLKAGAVSTKESADIVHTELCSLHMDPLAHSPEQLVVQSLFADGFIKYTVTPQADGARLEILSLYEAIIPESVDDMSWRSDDTGMKMTLSKDVPQVIANALKGFLGILIERAGLLPADIENPLFAIHPGGSKIIEEVKEMLQLTDSQVLHSLEVLKNFGNMSSATLPHVWERILQSEANNSYVVSLAFGPGLTICGGLFQIKGK